MTKPIGPDLIVYTVLHLDDGMYVPARLRIRNSMVRETTHIVEPCPYRALAYQALEAAIAQEYLADALRTPKKPKDGP